MAFNANTERCLVRVQAPSPVGLASGAQKNALVGLFAYSTDDAAATVEAAGYFNSARARLTVGTIILASMVNGGTPVLKAYVVLTVPTTGNVTIGLLTTTAG